RERRWRRNQERARLPLEGDQNLRGNRRRSGARKELSRVRRSSTQHVRVRDGSEHHSRSRAVREARGRNLRASEDQRLRFGTRRILRRTLITKSPYFIGFASPSPGVAFAWRSPSAGKPMSRKT